LERQALQKIPTHTMFAESSYRSTRIWKKVVTHSMTHITVDIHKRNNNNNINT